MLDRQLLVVARTDDLGVGSVSEHEGGECDRDGDGFQMPRRYVDDQPGHLAAQDAFELMRHGMNVPVVLKRLPTDDGRKGLLHERGQVLAKHRLRELYVWAHRFSP